MGYLLLADFIVFLHFLFLAFVVVGQLLILTGMVLRWEWTRNFWFRAIHLFFVAIVVVEAAMGVPCPLTTWEFELRAMGEQPISDISFTGRVLHFFVFWADTNWDDPRLQWSYYAFGGIVLFTLLLFPPRLPRRKIQPEESTPLLEPRVDS